MIAAAFALDEPALLIGLGVGAGVTVVVAAVASVLLGRCHWWMHHL